MKGGEGKEKGGGGRGKRRGRQREKGKGRRGCPPPATAAPGSALVQYLTTKSEVAANYL